MDVAEPLGAHELKKPWVVLHIAGRNGKVYLCPVHGKLALMDVTLPELITR